MISRVRRGETPNPITVAAIQELEAGKGEVIYGEQLMDEVIKEPTLNRYLDGNPKVINKDPQSYRELVLLLQRKRAAFITAEAKKKEPKLEGEDNVQAED